MEALTFGHRCSQNAVRQNLHECEYFIAVGRRGRGVAVVLSPQFRQHPLSGIF